MLLRAYSTVTKFRAGLAVARAGTGLTFTAWLKCALTSARLEQGWFRIRMSVSSIACGEDVPSLGLTAADRILVTGSTGWFGQTFLSLMPKHKSVLALPSSIEDSTMRWTNDLIREFRPTVVANFAFLTRDRLSEVGEPYFVSTNRQLTRQFLTLLEQPSVRLGLTISSGAVSDEFDIYGKLKSYEESEALKRVTDVRAVAVVRAYSVSGPYVRRPRAYALSQFVLDAARGNIHIMADRPVFRRYSSVSDLLKVALLMADGGWSGILESGGDLVEMEVLAERVRREVNQEAMITRVPLASVAPQVYASDNTSWLSGCASVGLEPQSLENQIRLTRDFLLGSQP